jgi:hypothetical protein
MSARLNDGSAMVSSVTAPSISAAATRKYRLAATFTWLFGRSFTARGSHMIGAIQGGMSQRTAAMRSGASRCRSRTSSAMSMNGCTMCAVG